MVNLWKKFGTFVQNVHVHLLGFLTKKSAAKVHV